MLKHLFAGVCLLMLAGRAVVGREGEFLTDEPLPHGASALGSKYSELESRLARLETQVARQGFADVSNACDFAGRAGRCDCSGPWYAGAGFYWVKPHWENNPAFAVRQDDDAPDSVISSRNSDFNWDHGPAWDVWVGYEAPNRIGARGRYWQFDRSALIPDSDPTQGDPSLSMAVPAPLGVAPWITRSGSTSFQESYSFESSLRLQLWDLETVWTGNVGECAWEFSGGISVGRTRQTFEFVNDISGFDDFYQIVVASWHDFDGLGPTLGFRVEHAMGHAGLAGFGRGRATVLAGKAEAAAEASMETNGEFRQVAEVFDARWDSLPILDLEVGLRFQRELGSLRLFCDAGLLAQVWFGAGNAADSGPFRGNYILEEPGFPDSDNSANMTLFGGRFSAGFEL